MLALREVTHAASDLGIQALTVYGFSTENWRRDSTEISLLLDLCVHFAQHALDRLEAVARQLHMTEPSKVAFITTPAAPRPTVRAFALFARILGVTRWFGVR